MANLAARSGAASTAYLIMIQVVSRGLTFVGNQALLRYVSPDHLGLAVQLEALSVSILYTSRESLRVALQRLPRKKSNSGSDAGDVQKQGAVNAGYLVILVGILLGLVLESLYSYRAGSELLNATHFKPAFWLYAVATFVELSSEPGFIVAQQNDMFRIRARAETTAAIARCITACVAALTMDRIGSRMSVLPFAAGQLCYAISLFFVYYWAAFSAAASNGFSVLPLNLKSSPDVVVSRFSKSLLALAGAFYGQSIFKWLLTQGDTLVLSLFAGLEEQGIFALASNYGGLASRLLFQPVEESSRNVFGGLLAHENDKTPKAVANRRAPSSSIDQRNRAMNYLSTTLRLYILLILMPCCAILPQCFPILISALLGSSSRWSSPQTISLLQAYSYYIPVLAVNGVLDAFVTSVATEMELGAQSIMMLGVTMIYVSAAYFNMTVMQLGAVGLVYANILNMFLRIGFSLWFIKAWTQQNLPTKLGDKTSAFANFCRRASPTSASIFMFVLTVLSLYGQQNVKDYLQDNATVVELSRLKLSSTNLDFFGISYILSAAMVLLSSIIFAENDFLVHTVEPLLPQRARTFLQRIFESQKPKNPQKVD